MIRKNIWVQDYCLTEFLLQPEYSEL